jgi:cytochrome bd-type quinol oxidase subunit 2
MKKVIALLFLLSLMVTTYAAEAAKVITLKDVGVFKASVPDDQFGPEFAESRATKLHHHKKMGQVTMGLMTATFLTALWSKHEVDDARAKRGGQSSTDDANKYNLHMGLALTTLVSYYATAYYSLSAPKPQGMVDEKARNWHKGLAWVHGTAMVLAPVLGLLALKDYHDGKNPEGIAKLHKPVMMAGFAAFAAAFTIATLEF